MMSYRQLLPLFFQWRLITGERAAGSIAGVEISSRQADAKADLMLTDLEEYNDCKAPIITIGWYAYHSKWVVCDIVLLI